MMNRFLKNSTFLLITSLLASCAISHEQALGKYQFYGYYGVGSNIELKDDSSFIYNWQTGLIWRTTEGKWQLENNILVLNSYRQPKTKKFTLIENSVTDVDFLSVRVVDTSNEGMPFSNCYLLQDTTVVGGGITDIDGNCELNVAQNANFLLINSIFFKEAKLI